MDLVVGAVRLDPRDAGGELMNLSSNCTTCGRPFAFQAVVAKGQDWRCKSHTAPEVVPVDDMPENIEVYRNFKAEERWA